MKRKSLRIEYDNVKWKLQHTKDIQKTLFMKLVGEKIGKLEIT